MKIVMPGDTRANLDSRTPNPESRIPDPGSRIPDPGKHYGSPSTGPKPRGG